MNPKFLPKKITSTLTWRQLLINEKEFRLIKKLETRLNKQVLESNKSHLALFHGPPGTGKTLTASLLGKYTGRDVYRVDLFLVISKYIGETEKNLATIFQKLLSKDAILFFDEADAIFGKRTAVRDAHDKFANQEVSYLLQKIENHPGLVIFSVATLKNIDDSFTRRFETIVAFKHLSVMQRSMFKFKNYFRTFIRS
ncbi:hypothetical protein ULMS_09300 [Patiriisocius marinistellae]|uniref:AAA+ ATPase domain-containing protein n=1 Tax=Patiriisocius marinistellae TaxID=2494560 RepID=A0A5J4FW65_9FLAO|nr:ATP-binding protein [Patiriisocius marinistellae]GEQ85422.1 hypothetical protein ULMS_09300 [Patiriisocius marinistellae]